MPGFLNCADKKDEAPATGLDGIAVMDSPCPEEVRVSRGDSCVRPKRGLAGGREQVASCQDNCFSSREGTKTPCDPRVAGPLRTGTGENACRNPSPRL